VPLTEYSRLLLNFIISCDSCVSWSNPTELFRLERVSVVRSAGRVPALSGRSDREG